MKRLTFAQARQIVDDADRASWPSDAGTFMVSTEGAEEASWFRVVTGAREWLIDEEDNFMDLGSEAILVSKETGEIVRLPVLPNLDRLNAMSPVGLPDV